MATETDIFIGLAIFYGFIFTMAGLIPSADVSIASGDSGSYSDALSPLDSYTEASWFSPITDFIENVFSNIEGMPTIFQGLLFTPMLLFGVYWLIVFILKFIPFIG